MFRPGSPSTQFRLRRCGPEASCQPPLLVSTVADIPDNPALRFAPLSVGWFWKAPTPWCGTLRGSAAISTCFSASVWTSPPRQRPRREGSAALLVPLAAQRPQQRFWCGGTAPPQPRPDANIHTADREHSPNATHQTQHIHKHHQRICPGCPPTRGRAVEEYERLAMELTVELLCVSRCLFCGLRHKGRTATHLVRSDYWQRSCSR